MRSFFANYYDFFILKFASVQTLKGGKKAAEYYLKYLEHGENPGFWFDPDGVLKEFGIEHGTPITGKSIEAFKALCAGRNPISGDKLLESGIADDAHKAGNDLQLAPPKDFSVLWGLADSKMRLELDKVFHEAALETLHMVSKRMVYTRTGKGGEFKVHSTAMIGASFAHSESRMGDPHRHMHNFILNLIKSQDGKWRVMDIKEILDNQKFAGAWLRSVLAKKLRQIGFTVTHEKGVNFRIESVPQELIDMWSRRSKEILIYAKEKGLLNSNGEFINGDARNKAIYATRPDKELGEQERFERWQDEARQFGIDIDKIFKLSAEEIAKPSREEIAESVFDNDSVLAKQDVILKLIDQSISHHSPLECESMFEELVTEGKLVQLYDTNKKEILFTTQELQKAEQNIVAITRELSKSGLHHIDPNLIEDILSKSTATDEQKEAVRHATKTNSIAVIEGSAGTGKTFTTKTIRDVFQAAGYEIQGLALGWDQARNLGIEAEIPYRAIHGYLLDLESGKATLNNKTVVIVDEAGLNGSKHTEKLLAAVEKSGAKIIFAGDEKQLNPVLAGPAMRLVIQEIGSQRIDTIVRQQHEWQRQMVADFRDGRSNDAINALDKNGYLVETENWEATLKQVSNDFFEHSLKHPDESRILLVATNSELEQVSKEVRALKKAAGQLMGPDHTIACDIAGKKVNLDFAVGDTIRFTQNDKKIGVINKDEGTVVSITTARKSALEIAVRLTDGKTVKFNTSEYLNKKTKVVPIRYSDVTTVFSAQGATRTRAFLVYNQMMDRKAIYVACSRFKQSMKLYFDKVTVNSLISKKENLSPTRLDRIEAIAKRVHSVKIKKSTLDQGLVLATSDVKKIMAELAQSKTLSNNHTERQIRKSLGAEKQRSEPLFSRERVASFIGGFKKWLSRIIETNKEKKHGQAVTR